MNEAFYYALKKPCKNRGLALTREHNCIIVNGRRCYTRRETEDYILLFPRLDKRRNKMKYQKELDEMFSYFHESWMDENDKENFNKDILKEMNTTMVGLDIMFEQGVEKGYSIETQLSLAKQLISSVM